MTSRRAVLLAAVLAVCLSANASVLRLGGDVVPVTQDVRLRVDPRADRFQGSVRVELDVKRPSPHFRFHAVDMTLDAVKLDGASVPHAPDIDQTVRVTAAQPIAPGRHTLEIEYNAPFNRAAVGLYKVMKDGEPYLFTQFQAIDARKAFPCWDEPGFKLPYQLTVEIPTQYTAISNTPIAEESESDPWKTVKFATTKPLPSYLIALAVGRFDFTGIEGISVPGRIVAPKGQGALTSVAADVTRAVHTPLETWFGSRYPFEKIDHIAVPEFWAGAMENAGAITYRDSVLLADAARMTPAQKRGMVRIAAHELAHMWFGDLVTMEWWDDFWLNESFADWMGDKITEQVYPELGHSMAEMQGLQNVMNMDARATTGPIRDRKADPLDSMRNVGLAYDKGKAVLSMFEQWIGPEKFRQGVLDYLKANEWANGNAEEFFAALGRHSPKGTVAAMESFIEQPGIPLLNLERKGRQLHLSQKRFTNAGSKLDPQTWRVPVTVRYSDGKQTRTASVLLDGPAKTIALQGGRVDWLFPHADAAGYYRWQLPADDMRALASRATEVLSPRERLAFLGNIGALLRAGSMHGGEYLEVLSRFGADPHPQVVQAALAASGAVKFAFVTDENREAWASYVRRTFGPALQRIGLTAKPDEEPTITILRPALLMWMAEEGQDREILTWAQERTRSYLSDSSSVDPTIASAVIAIAAREGDEALFNEFVKRFEAAKVPAERSRFLGAIGRFRRDGLRARALEYSLRGPLRPTELFAIPAAGNETAADRDEYFRFVTTNYDEIMKRLPPIFAGAMPGIGGGCEPERLEKTREFFATRKAEGTERTLSRVTEQVNECVELRSRELNDVTAYLRRQ